MKIRCTLVIALSVLWAGASLAQTRPWSAIGRSATPAEVKAWDIDVRADFKGLPPGSGSVAQGQDLWEAKCASCHGVFGESNEVFTPLVGGTTQADIERGRVASLSATGVPHRTTLMKVSKLSSLWDYIHRAMPWNAPKSLSVDEVYAATAYLLSLADVVPADFTLSDRNIAEVQKRLPNRDGHVFDADLWDVAGKGDVKNTACMKNCPVEGRITSSFPDSEWGANGNLAQQNRLVGPVRGLKPAGPAPAMPAASSVSAAPDAGLVVALLERNACTACHGVAQKIVGPAFRDVAARHGARADAVDYLAGRIRSGGQGVWGAIPMPAQTLAEDDARRIAHWIASGAK
jgi:S-disulfanyl-L-cysteine oxidoreductase SoxD